jgi:hypothetical protein
VLQLSATLCKLILYHHPNVDSVRRHFIAYPCHNIDCNLQRGESVVLQQSKAELCLNLIFVRIELFKYHIQRT